MFHDCGHNSFLPTTKANRNLGFWLGILVFTPGEEWWHSHAIHHATSGNLDKRGMGDVMTYTIEEYTQMTPIKKFGYKLFRNPLVMFILGPIYMFFFQHRFPIPNFGPRENKDLILHNFVLAVYLVLMSVIIGWKIFLPAQFLIMWLGGMGGIWLFFVQHQYENVYWARDNQWDYTSSAILGASYYDLPELIQWFTGNIGFHHIHHLNPKIPNYNLGLCYDANPILQQNQRTITIRESLKLPKLVLIDEISGKMVTFDEIKGMKAQSKLTYS
jgi:omega-6 fatty acid desaturase (delta-12 desaturase)